MKYSGNVLITWLAEFNTWNVVLVGKIIQIQNVHEITRFKVIREIQMIQIVSSK